MSRTRRYIPHWADSRDWRYNIEEDRFYYHRRGGSANVRERDRYINGYDKHHQEMFVATSNCPKGIDKWDFTNSRKGKRTERRLTHKILRNKAKNEIRKTINERVFD